jgi:ribA/ribD-fused uncharacterized protein
VPTDNTGPIEFLNVPSNPYKAFSNLYLASFTIDGVVWKSSEHYFQSQKFPDDPALQEAIRNTETPAFAKLTATTRGKGKVRQDLPQVRDSIMSRALYAKFTQNPELKKLLLSTGQRKLIDATLTDNYWGIGPPEKRNKMGELLEELRTKLRNDDKPIIYDKIEDEDAAAMDKYEAVKRYEENMQKAIKQLQNNADEYMKIDPDDPEKSLANYSPKYHKIIESIKKKNDQSALVYSQFKTLEGLGIFEIAMKANGFVKIDFDINDSDEIVFSEDTIKSFEKGPEYKSERRFIYFTGKNKNDKLESIQRRQITLDIFNGEINKLPSQLSAVLQQYKFNTDNLNKYGDICQVIGITSAGAEGISLKCCRNVHIIEPYWNMVRLEQVKGRAARICSHQPFDNMSERYVNVYTYLITFSEEQLQSDTLINKTIRLNDRDRTTLSKENKILTVDERIYKLAKKKDIVNQKLQTIMKQSAIDCNLNYIENLGEVRCIRVEGTSKQYMFHPNLDDDIIETHSMTHPQKIKDDIELTVIDYRGTKCVLYPMDEIDTYKMYLYDGFNKYDIKSNISVGKLTKDPSTDTFNDACIVQIYKA